MEYEYEYIELNIIDGKFSIYDKEFILPNYNKLHKTFTENNFVNHTFGINELYLLGNCKNKLYFILQEQYDDYGNIPTYIFNQAFDIVTSFSLSLTDNIKYFDSENGNIITTSGNSKKIIEITRTIKNI